MKFCPRCHRPEGDGSCVMESLPGFTCPEPVEETSDTAVISCGPCGFTRGVPVGDLMKGLAGDAALPKCLRDECQAKLLHPEVKPGPERRSENLVPPAPGSFMDKPKPAAKTASGKAGSTANSK